MHLMVLGLLLVLVGFVNFLDYSVELYILVCDGQNWTDIGSVKLCI